MSSGDRKKLKCLHYSIYVGRESNRGKEEVSRVGGLEKVENPVLEIQVYLILNKSLGH